MNFISYIGHTFRIIVYHIKLTIHFIQNYVTLKPMSQFGPNLPNAHTIVNYKVKRFCGRHFFHQAHIFFHWAQHYLENINLLYLEQEPDFDKFLDPNIKFKKKTILLMKYFRFYMGFFSRTNEYFHILKFSLNTYSIIFHSPKGNFKWSFQL